MTTRHMQTRCREVDAFEMEEASEVHRDVGVHRLEDGTGATGFCIFELAELIHGAHCSLSHGVVAIDDSYLVIVDEILIHLSVLEAAFVAI